MPIPAASRAPQHRPPTTAQSIVAALFIGLMLLVLLVQCVSSLDTGTVESAPSRTTPPAPVTTSTSDATPEAVPPSEPTGDETKDDETTVVDVIPPVPPNPMPRTVPQPPPATNYSDDTDSGGGSVYYKNCAAARAAGAAPLYAGEPGYASHLDRDDDGVACES